MSIRLVLAATISAVSLAAPAFADTVLRVGTFLAPTGVWHAPIARYIDAVNARNAGIRLELIADPSSVPPGQLGEAVSSGVLDIAYVSGSFYLNLVPEADAQRLFDVTVQEARANGALELLDQIHRERMGATLLGKPVDGVTLHIYLSAAPQTDDLSGLDLRGSSLYRQVMEGMGANVVAMPPSDIFSAMQSGVIDGYGWPRWGIGDIGLLEVTGVRLEPGFYSTEIALLANAARFDSLTDEQRAVLVEEAIAAENWFIEFRAQTEAAEMQRQADAGIEVFSFSPETTGEMRRIAYDNAWADVIARSSEHGERLQSLLRRPE